MTSAKPVTQNLLETEAVSLEIEVEIPFLNDSAVGEDTEIALEKAELTDEGTIRLTCLARAFSADSATSGRTSPEHVFDEKSRVENRDGDEYDNANQLVDERGTGNADKPRQGEKKEESTNDSHEAERETCGSGEPEIPPYQDPEKLREVYEKYDTFTEMTDALDVDVTPQTVRRYMIKHNIHEPSSTTGSSSISTLLEADPDSFPPNTRNEERDNSGGDDPTESTQIDGVTSSEETLEVAELEDQGETSSVVSQDGGIEVSMTDADSEEGTTLDEEDLNRSASELIDREIEVPDDYTLAEIKDIVQNAHTLYDVERAMGLERRQVREILQKLNLLDLVHGRLSSRNFQEKTVDEINSRIQSAIRETD